MTRIGHAFLLLLPNPCAAVSRLCTSAVCFLSLFPLSKRSCNPATSESVCYGAQIGGKYVVFRTQPGSSQREQLAEIPLRDGTIPSWVHDFPYTENYIILPETPCYFDLKVPRLPLYHSWCCHIVASHMFGCLHPMHRVAISFASTCSSLASSAAPVACLRCGART